MLGRGGAAPWMWFCSPPSTPLCIERRGKEKLGKNSGNMTAWWWSSQFSGRASPSSTEEEEVLGEGGLRLGSGRAALPHTSIYRVKGKGGRPPLDEI